MKGLIYSTALIKSPEASMIASTELANDNAEEAISENLEIGSFSFIVLIPIKQ